jgi:ABC-type multidrug transport system ATPase subunit
MEDNSPIERKKMPIFVPLHFKAVLFRRWIMIKRSLKTVIISTLGTVIFSALAIVCYYLMVSMMKSDTKPFTFNSYKIKTDYIITVGDKTNIEYLGFRNAINNTFTEDTGKEPIFLDYATLKDANNFTYHNAMQKGADKVDYINFGLVYNGLFPKKTGNTTEYGYNITLLYNSTQLTNYKMSQVSLLRIMWKSIFGQENDFKVSLIRLFLKIQEMAFAQLGPMLITSGICSIIPLMIAQPIIDINGEVRPYMVSCTLTIFPYWLATFLIDFGVWIFDVTVVWAVMLACQIKSFHDNMFNTWYGLVASGPSFIIFLYCISFAFSSADSAARQAFLILTILLLVPMIIDIVRDFKLPPVWLEFIYALFPQILLMRVLYFFLSNIGIMKQDLAYYFKDKNARVYLIMQYVDIVIYVIILIIIEKVRLKIQRKSAQRDFGNYTQFFKEQKEKHPITQETLDMEEKVHDPNNKYAVRIKNASRLFFNTIGEPIPAVNCVSLGVKEGSLFGFLGANGAGKTTLIRMITSLLPASDGTIEINGVDITEYKDPTAISICPQFNTHLCFEMTTFEHFRLYAMLFRMDKEEGLKKAEKLIKLLELEDIKDKPIRDLSAGDVRKLAIALCFLSPAKIILLDEPTASLDPVARKAVHEMIIEFKGEKTFMLCTHLLSEAESLCDEISIMMKGNVYTIGSPQYLSSRFGTEFKIDIQLTDESPETSQKVDKFFEEQIPEAELTIMRPKARIYSCPAKATTLPKLFDVMQNGKNGDNGFNYFTCSSSSLERVFMEIVHMSELEDIMMVRNDEPKKEVETPPGTPFEIISDNESTESDKIAAP